VAHGLSHVYPPEHAGIARQMLPTGGLLSEYPFHKKAEREHFPMRNRLIAGISDALIVVETRKKGGSMITANLANAYNKEVFAFPGRPTDEKSSGCNALIKQHKALLIENAADVVRIMNWDSHVSQQLSFREDLFHGLSDEEKNVLLLLGKKAPVSFEEIAQQLSTPQNLLSGILLELEFKGLVKSLPGNRFTRI
jgi:DNA processing protein